MVECGICLEEYQEGNLELHLQTCVLRLMFRCSLCDGDYVNKEGLWNHLDFHEIADESKELHYQEIKAKHKLHQCVLCNDQRAYSESCYWMHIHDVHDGFFLRCSDCGEKFRSEQLKNEHACSRCEVRDETVASNFNVLKKRPVPIAVETTTSGADHLELTREEQSGIANKELNNGLAVHSHDQSNYNIIDKESASPTINSAKSKDLPSQFACDICGATFSSKGLLSRHKKIKYTCLDGGLHKCPYCRRVFRLKEYQAHIILCEKRKFSCELCSMKFMNSKNLGRHMRSVHRGKGILKNAKQDQNQVKKIMELNSSSNSNVDDEDTGTGKKDTADESVQQPPSRSSSSSSGTKCLQCGKECVRASCLRKHIEQMHQPTKCSICAITFEGTAKARYHKIKKHTEPKIKCAKCSMKFCFKSHYKRHSEACDPIQKELSSHENCVELFLKERSDPKVLSENPSSEPSGIKCSHCGIYEASAVTLARHIQIHHDPVACDFCGITLSNFTQAEHHVKTMHKEGTLKCPHCSMQFACRSRLQSHVGHCENEKVPCDFCGRMFKNVFAANQHRRAFCRVYKSIKEQEEQKKAETSLCVETDSSTIMEKVSTRESDLSPTKCFYCNEEFSSAGYLMLHLKISHKLTKCDICGITVIGISGSKNHKIKCHLEPKYECPTCGKKFHRKVEFNVHCFRCQGKRYLCKLCGKKIKLFRSAKLHNERFHPDESSTENIQIVQEQEQEQDEGNELEMEITAGETIISARDDQGQSTVNSSLKVDVSNSRSNGRSSANLNDDELMDSQVIDKDSRMLSVAPLNCISERQAILDKTSQPLVEKQYSCNICGIIFQSYSTFREHKLKKHMRPVYQCPHCTRKFHHRGGLDKHVPSCAELKYSCELCGAKFDLLRYLRNHKKRIHQELKKHTRPVYQCPHCTRIFHNRSLLEEHVPSCADLKYSCELCGAKFNLLRYLKNHEKKIHRSDRPLRNANIEGADCTEEQKQISVEKVDAAQEVTSCIICRITFASTDELMKHKLHCTNHGKDHDDPQFGAKEDSLLHDLKGTQNDSTTAMQDENIDLELEIKVEETMLQEQEYQDQNEDPGRSFATDLDPDDGESKDVEAEDADDLEKEIKVKKECLEDEEIIETHQQTSTECHEEPIDRNESRMRHEVMDVHSKEAKKKSNPQRRKLPLDYTERRSSKRIRVKTKKLNC